MTSGQDAGADYDLWDGAGIEGGFLTDELAGALGDAADYGLPQFTPDMASFFQLEADATAGSREQAAVDPSAGPANPTEPAEDAVVEPADKQKREYVRWAPEEEQSFFDVLKTVLGQKPERCFQEVSKVLQTKDFNQVRQYYYRLIKRLNKILSPECKLDSKNNLLVHQSMVKFWDVFVEKGMHGTHMMAMVKKPRKQKMLNVGVQKGVAAVLRNAELAEKRAAKRRAAAEASAEQPEGAAPKKRRQLPPRISAPSESVAHPAALRTAEAGGLSQAPTPASYSVPSALQQVPDVGNQAIGREGSSTSKGEQHLDCLAKEHEVNFERQGISTSHGVSGSMLHRDQDTGLEKLELHLVPSNAATEAALRSAGYHPLLAITCRWSKSIVSIMKHIRGKWQLAIPADAENMFFHADDNCPLPLRGMKWGGVQCDPQLKIGDIHASLQCPARLRLLYSWEPAVLVEATPRQLPPTRLPQGATLNVGSILRDAIAAVTANPESKAASYVAQPPYPQHYRPAFLPEDQAGRLPAQQPVSSALPLPVIHHPNAGVLMSAQSFPQPGLWQQGAAASFLQAVSPGLLPATGFGAAGASQARGDAAAGGAASALAPTPGQPADAVGVGARKPHSSKAPLQLRGEAAASQTIAKKQQPKGNAKNSKKASPPAAATQRVPLSAVQQAAPSVASQEPLAPFMWQLHQSLLAQPQVLQQPAKQAATPGFHPGLNGDSLMNFLDATACTGPAAPGSTPQEQAVPAAAPPLPGSADLSLKSWPSLSPPSNFDLPDGFDTGLFPSATLNLHEATPPQIALATMGPTDFSQFSLLLGADGCSPIPRMDIAGAGPTLTAKRAVDALFQQARPDAFYQPASGAAAPSHLAAGNVLPLPEKDVCDLAYDFGSLLGVGDTPSWMAPASDALPQQGKTNLGDQPFAGLFT